ncbi:MAG: tryptophan synthase subunit alpha [Acidobacteriota bacterium]
MNRITAAFKRLRGERRCGLIAYVTCGDPDVPVTVDIVRELERSGADLIELGIPFSDPIADGPVIQAASYRALQRGTTIDDVFRIAASVREQSTIPLIAFSYLNPILRYGLVRFAQRAAESGIDGVLVTDLPPEAADEFRATMRGSGLVMIFLATPTTPDRRLRLIDRFSDGFVYYVSTTGVTGSRRELAEGLLERLKTIRQTLRHPLAVGFGVSRREHFLQLREVCDAVVVGSAIVNAVGEGDDREAPRRAGNVVRAILGGVPLP